MAVFWMHKIASTLRSVFLRSFVSERISQSCHRYNSITVTFTVLETQQGAIRMVSLYTENVKLIEVAIMFRNVNVKQLRCRFWPAIGRIPRGGRLVRKIRVSDIQIVYQSHILYFKQYISQNRKNPFKPTFLSNSDSILSPPNLLTHGQTHVP